jgi:hypothetical protein
MIDFEKFNKTQFNIHMMCEVLLFNIDNYDDAQIFVVPSGS